MICFTERLRNFLLRYCVIFCVKRLCDLSLKRLLDFFVQRLRAFLVKR